MAQLRLCLGTFLRATAKGCIYCSGTKLAEVDFVDGANITHDYKYDYTEVVLKNASTPVKVICPTHGPFLP